MSYRYFALPERDPSLVAVLVGEEARTIRRSLDAERLASRILGMDSGFARIELSRRAKAKLWLRSLAARVVPSRWARAAKHALETNELRMERDLGYILVQVSPRGVVVLHGKKVGANLQCTVEKLLALLEEEGLFVWIPSSEQWLKEW